MLYEDDDYDDEEKEENLAIISWMPAICPALSWVLGSKDKLNT